MIKPTNILKFSTIILASAIFFNTAIAAPNYQTYGSASQANWGSSKNTNFNNYSQNYNNVNVYTPTSYTQNSVVQKNKSDIIELVVDYSSSMYDWLSLTKTTVQKILPQIPYNTYVGLRVFGQYQEKKSSQVNSNNLFTNVVAQFNILSYAEDSCKATKQVVPLTNMNKTSVVTGLNSTLIGSMTPLTLALKETVNKDFAGKSLNLRKKIILVTDGAETCGGDPCAYAAQLMGSRRDITIDVIMIGGSNELRCLADATGGKFYKVNDKQSFDNALQTTFETKPAQSSNTSNYTPQQTQSNQYNYQFIPD